MCVYKNFLDKIYGLKNCLTMAIHNGNKCRTSFKADASFIHIIKIMKQLFLSAL